MSIHPPVSSPLHAPRRPTVAGVVMSPWMWMAVTCLLLGISGGVRFWREWQFKTLAAKNQASPFHLSELPMTVDTWRADEDSQDKLDPEVARFAGASEHVVRGYLDEKSGEKASALILYGLATMVYLHTPDICYPSAGYQLVKGPIDRSITVPGVEGPVQYRWAIYVKRVGGISRYEETYYTFHHGGEWLSDVSGRWKSFRYQPGLFKIQIAHPVTSLSEDSQGPCESLLAGLVQQVDGRLGAGGRGQAEAPASAAPTAPPAKAD